MIIYIVPIINGYRKIKMNDLVTDVKNLELETLKNLKSSKAVNTLRAYKADFRDFDLFCQKNDLNQCLLIQKLLQFI